MGNKKETSFSKEKKDYYISLSRKISLLPFNVIFSHICSF